jgi:dienelactone hydrolase
MVVFLPDYLPTMNDPETDAIAGALTVPFLEDVAHAQDTANRGYQQLVGLSMVDPEKISAIGFCFGGAMVLNLARTGAQLVVAVSLHGEYPARGTVEDESWNTNFFIEMVGADDPAIPDTARDSWVAELSEHTAGTDNSYDLVIYGNTMHGFSMQYTQMFMQTLATMQGSQVTEMDVDGVTVYGTTGFFEYSPTRQKETFDRIDDLFEEHMMIGDPMTTCGSVKDYYRDNGCCGMPEKMIPMMMMDDEH